MIDNLRTYASYGVTTTTSLDGKGKTLIPGIINLHGHVGLTKGLAQAQENYSRGNVIDNLRTYASYGVTTTTSLGTDMDLVIGVRDSGGSCPATPEC